jgi:hypothetical protein
MTVIYRYQSRRRTAANWTSGNEVLYDGEIGYETDTGKFKIGDGVTAWNSITDYFEAGAGGGGGTWGSITGTLSAQTDLNTALSGKVATTVTVNGQALSGNVTLTTAHVSDSSNKRYVTDAQLTVIGNTSGTNTGDQTNISGNAATVTTNANLTGHVTSVGNAAVLGSFTVAQLNTALSDGDIATGGGTATGTNTGDQDLSSYATTSAVAAGYQPKSTNLTTVAGLGSASQQLRTNAGGTAVEWFTPAAASGDVVGPASSTDNAIARFDSTTGKLLQDMSKATIADTGAVSITPDANATALTVASHTQTASNPWLNVAQTWNNAAVDFVGESVNYTNTASGAASVVWERKVGGNRVAAFTKSGGFTHYTGATTADHATAWNFQGTATGAQAASGANSFLTGRANTASGAESVVLGGYNNIASGAGAICGGGFSNTASGNETVALGSQNTASGVGAVCIGVSNTASGGYGAVSIGYEASTSNRAVFAHAGLKFAAAGDAQSMIASLKAATTDATQTTMQAASANFVIPADTAWAFSALIVGRSNEADGNDCAAWTVTGLLKRDESNNTTIVGTITKTLLAADAGAAAWDVTIEADNTNEALAVKVTGDAATNIRWVAKVDIASVTYA